eukprot:gene9003-1102_t
MQNDKQLFSKSSKEFQLLGIEPSDLIQERKLSLEEAETIKLTGNSVRNRRKMLKTHPTTDESESSLPHKTMKLSEVLADENLYFIFKQFSMKEFSSENLFFLENVKQYETTIPSKRFRKVLDIFNDFLSKDAPLQVNIQSIYVHKIEDVLNETSPTLEDDLFSEIVEQVTNLLKDTYSRFKESQEFKEYRESLLNPDEGQNLKVDFEKPRRSVSDAIKDIFKPRKSVSTRSPSSSSPSRKKRSAQPVDESITVYDGLSDFKM